MKVIGYGICGPGEARRYMRQTLEEFKRLCDTVVILCNNTDHTEHALIDEYGFTRVSDRREWGRFQWKIKQDFIERDIKRIAEPGDMIVCLDMDEVFDPALTKEWLINAPLDAYRVFVVDLWNDPYHFKMESCFWNVRIWRWNGETKFKVKPVHCGLAPEWAYLYHRHAPFYLLHSGLMLPEDRERKIARYEKYDPHAEHLDRKYYDMLRSNTAKPFDPVKMHEEIAAEVASYNETKPKQDMNNKPKERFAYVKNPHGEVVDIPERHLAMTMKRKGFEFIGWADEQDNEVDALFDEEEEKDEDTGIEAPHAAGSYQRSAADEKRELDGRNMQDDKDLDDADTEGMIARGEEANTAAPTASEIAGTIPPAAHPKPDPNKKEDSAPVSKVKAPAKKATKKAAKKATKKK